jgi:uncharacterized protein DUF4440
MLKEPKPKGYVISEKTPAQPADKTALLSELMKLEAASWQSLKDKNVSAMNKYLADDAVLIFGNGIHFTKAEFIKEMPDIRLDSFTIEPNAEIKVWTPEVATLLYRITTHQCVQRRECLHGKSAVVEYVCAQQWQLVERDLSRDTSAVISPEGAPRTALPVAGAAG